ncbi:peptidase inhibitor family I36 protein [Oligoflexus tunisiensis]|uniref:peptidase inhibitor family I36 protein n=1 Tax=Oligoflexus tunisiensis TaxID=708132 RepID=UPI00114D138D|nr:peptidase inhibitor family I36 protein [Oligoflexus tunisiensis]
MKRFFLLIFLAQPALSAECLYYKEPNRGGTVLEQKANQNADYNLASGWGDQVSSVWVKDGYYAVLFEHPGFRGSNTVYVYGSGLSFAKNVWQRTGGSTVNGGTSFNLDRFGLDNLISATLCLKE